MQVIKYKCDICDKEFRNENYVYSNPFYDTIINVDGIEIAIYYNTDDCVDEATHQIKDVCKDCTEKILITISKLRASNLDKIS